MDTCKLNKIDPDKWLVKVLCEINETKTSDLHKLLPFSFEGKQERDVKQEEKVTKI